MYEIEIQPTSRRARTIAISHLVLILATAVLIRVHDLDRFSLWYDEVVTMRLARSPDPTALMSLLTRIDGTRAPLHPLVLQIWLRLFGDSELAGRSFSALCGILTVAVVYLLGRRLFDDCSGRWAAWFTAVCPPLVYYSQEARMYAWLVLLTCLSWLVLADFRQAADWARRIAYGALLTALVYSHPLGLFMVATHGLAFLLLRKSLALSIRSWLAIQCGVFLAIAPWLPRYLDHGTDYPLPRYSVRFLIAVPIEYIGGNSLVLAACLAIITLGLVSFQNSRVRPAIRPEHLLILIWMAAPPVAMFAFSQAAQPIFGPPRYHLFIAPAYLILLAHGLCRLPVPMRWTLAAGALYLSLGLHNAQVYSQVVKADWRGLARWLNQPESRTQQEQNAGPAVVVVHPSDPRFPRDQVEAARYYLSPPHRVIPSGTPVAESAAIRFDVHCLSAEQVRQEPRRPPKRDESFFYGLTVHRRGRVPE